MTGSSMASPSPTWTKVDSCLHRCEDGQFIILQACPEDPSLEIRWSPDDVEGLPDEGPDTRATLVTVGHRGIRRQGRQIQRSSFDQISEFDRGRIVTYRDCGLSFREIDSRVGRNQTL
ncbi:hypothetical protein LAZ67_22000209 [Cordylochernes scorpioides]|uniref:Uncharacterized protein n=1 Tax=Cordylochernes scorpioides TaxID=51811 RepID=A0ABY6LSY9_9ARAC|nr:hypothetical protein LAZ67_22000209 [Cordylochernes scorpioides]